MNKEQNLKRRRDLAKLIIARDMIRNAYTAILLLNKMEHDPRSNVLAHGLENSLIVNYGSAFLEMNPFGRIPAKWSKFNDVTLQKMHNQLINLRSKSVAHGDYSHKKVWINRKAINDASTEALGRYQFAVDAVSFSKEAYPVIISLCEYIGFEMHLAISNELYEIYGNIGDEANDFLLVSEDEV